MAAPKKKKKTPPWTPLRPKEPQTAPLPLSDKALRKLADEAFGSQLSHEVRRRLVDLANAEAEKLVERTAKALAREYTPMVQATLRKLAKTAIEAKLERMQKNVSVILDF